MSTVTRYSVLGKICEHKDPSEDGFALTICAAKNVDSLAFGNLLENLLTHQGTREAVSAFFSGVHTWFPIVERAGFEQELETTWGNLSAGMSILTLAIALVARPPNSRPSKLGDSTYHSTKTVLSLVQSKAPLSTQLLQAELLVALYEFSQSMPQQAYMSVGRCLHITRALRWHETWFWTAERQATMPRELKLCSILWWATVYLDCLLHVSYQDQAYPMHISDLVTGFQIPLPETFNAHFPPRMPTQFGGQTEEFGDANSDHIEGMVFPEAASAWYLRTVLNQLSNPLMPGAFDTKQLSDMILQHAKETAAVKWKSGDRNAAVVTDLIALMKLNQPGLYAGTGPNSVPNPAQAQSVQHIRVVMNVIHGRGRAIDSNDQLNLGAVPPCWGFAMGYASQLLIFHADDALQIPNWFVKVEEMRASLEKLSKRWKITERYTESVKIDLDNRLSEYAK
ncbi:hypothetical protein N0V88_003895 [Collariella sp. IMI 366227]|nr:hypothetical protein N0V88_003895 [Collariella sp. IMI 366227]